MSDILDRLKENQRWLLRDGFETSANNARDAIKEITALREQVEKLEKENLKLNQMYPATAYTVDLEQQLAAVTKERDEALARERNCAIATHRQAYCIQQCASTIGAGTSATIDGLPKAVKRVVDELSELNASVLKCGNDALRFTSFQFSVVSWMLRCFGPKIAGNKVERNHRFLEESLELVQSLGCREEDAHSLVHYVFNRPVGHPQQEVGGIMLTLAALCAAQGFDMEELGKRELARVWTKIEEIRAKQAAKPKYGPLPE